MVAKNGEIYLYKIYKQLYVMLNVKLMKHINLAYCRPSSTRSNCL